MIKKYNSGLYDLTITIESLDDEGNSRIIKPIYNDNISTLTIGNDITTFSPMLTLIYIDMGNSVFTNFYSDGRTYLKIKIIFNDQVYPVEIFHTFLVDKIIKETSGPRESKYRIECLSEQKVKLESYPVYSTQDEKSATEIVKDILLNVQFPITTASTENTPTDDDLEKDSDIKMTYICPVNKNVIDNIYYLARYSCSPNIGSFILGYNIAENLGRIVSLKKLYQKDVSDIQNYNKFMFNSETNMNYAMILSIVDQTTNTEFGGLDMYKAADIAKLFSFNYKERKWLQTELNPDRIKKGLPNPSSQLNEYIFKDIPEQVKNTGISFEAEYGNITGPAKICDRIEDIYKLNDMLEFTTFGVLKREVGDIIYIGDDHPYLGNRYNGNWLIGSIYHIFEGDAFISKIIAIRSDRKRIDNQAENNVFKQSIFS